MMDADGRSERVSGQAGAYGGVGKMGPRVGCVVGVVVGLFVSGRWLMSSPVVAVEGMDLSNLMRLGRTLHMCMCMQVCMLCVCGDGCGSCQDLEIGGSLSVSLCVCLSACLLYVCFTSVCPCLLYLYGEFRDTGPWAHVRVCVWVWVCVRVCSWPVGTIADFFLSSRCSRFWDDEFCLFMNHSFPCLSLFPWLSGHRVLFVMHSYIFGYTRPYRAHSFGCLVCYVYLKVPQQR